jgi:hypothetical protein
MPLIAETSISLRYFGDDLIPDALTDKLGKPPKTSQIKGETIIGKSTGIKRTAKTGSWIYVVERREPGDLDGQIEELFSALSPDLSVWRDLAAKYKPDLFVGLFLIKGNEGIEISAESLETLSSRGVSLSLDVYGPVSE